ncbi:MAG: hypothetical protein M1457_01715 [bacterium]|nr:hypothetical protein [bacterium]
MNRKTATLICLAFIPGAFLIGYNTWRVPFLSDDYVLLKAIAERGPFFSWAHYAGFPADFFRPLTSLSLWLDRREWFLPSSRAVPAGLRPVFFHATSLLLHGLNAGFVFLIARALMAGARGRRTLQARSATPAALAGWLFLALASHCEPVTWISGRADLLAAFFALWAFLVHVRARQGRNRGRRGGAAIGLAAVLYLLALLCKESALTLLGVFLAYDFIWAVGAPECGAAPAALPRPRRRGEASAVMGAFVTYGAVVAVYLGLRVATLGAWVGGYGRSVHMGFALDRLGLNLAKYAARSVLPPLDFAPDLAALVLVLLAALALGAARRIWRGAPGIAGPADGLLIVFLGAAWICLLAPVLNLAISLRVTDGERFLYLATAFSTILLVYLALTALRSPYRFSAVLSLLIAVQALAFFDASRNWRRAGAIAERILDQMRGYAGQGRLLIFNLPDNLEGAFIFRNGFQTALALRGVLPPGQPVEVVARQRLSHPRARARLTREGDRLTLRLLGLGDQFVSDLQPFGAAGEATPPAGYRIETLSLVACTLRLTWPEPDHILYFTGGVLMALEPPEPSVPPVLTIARQDPEAPAVSPAPQS